MKSANDKYTGNEELMEMLEKLRARAMLAEDEMAKAHQEGLTMCDPKLWDMGTEYENLCLDIDKLEALMKKYSE